MKTMGRRCVRAFTLVEIMLAIGIFGMVMVAIFASWSSILRGAAAGHRVAAEVQRNRMSMNALQSSLMSVQMFAGNLQHYYFYSDTGSDFAYLSLVSRLPASFPGSGLFGDYVVRRVTFSVEPGANRQSQLVMRQKPILEATNAVDDSYSLVLAKDVSLFTLEFWDTRLNDWVAEWLFTNQLPRMVRVTLGVGNRGASYRANPEEIVSRVVMLPGGVIAQQPGPNLGQPGGPGGPLGPGGQPLPGGPLGPGGQPLPPGQGPPIPPGRGRPGSGPVFTPGGPGGQPFQPPGGPVRRNPR